MIEHIPWIGRDYGTGIEGQRIAIVGYSHHRSEDEADTNDFTIETVRGVIDDAFEFVLTFLVQIRNYFGFHNHGGFWNRVVFFNYLPDCVGITDERYNYGTEEQIRRARPRVLRIIRETRPHELLVFTSKGWSQCPCTREEEKKEWRLPASRNGVP